MLQDPDHFQYYSSSSSAFLVAFSLADMSSLKKAKQIAALNYDRNTPIILVGTKADVKEREVSRSEALSFASSLGCTYLETSSASGFNVERSFQLAVSLVLADLRKDKLTHSLELEKNDQKTNRIVGVVKLWKSMRRKKHLTADISTSTPSVCYTSNQGLL